MKYSNLVNSPKFYFTCLFKDGKENLEFTFKYAAIFFSLTKKKMYIFSKTFILENQLHTKCKHKMFFSVGFEKISKHF